MQELETDSPVRRWRRYEGERIRATKGREGSPDPDWSLPEIGRDLPALAEDFFAWRRENAAAEETLEEAFNVWVKLLWEVPLAPAARGMLYAAVIAGLKRHVVDVEPFKISKMEKGEGVQAYLDRVLAENGRSLVPAVKKWPSGDDVSKAQDKTGAALAAEAERLIEAGEEAQAKRVLDTAAAAEARLPYRDDDDRPVPWTTPVPSAIEPGALDAAVAAIPEEKKPEEPELRCVACRAELGPFDTVYCSDACEERGAAEGSDGDGE